MADSRNDNNSVLSKKKHSPSGPSIDPLGRLREKKYTGDKGKKYNVRQRRFYSAHKRDE
jgi:hypothetical protein